MLSKKRPLTKWSCVVRRNIRSTLSTTSDKVRQIIGRTLVCVSIHLECWLNQARAEIVTWAAVGVARQQQFSHNSVSKFWQCERDQCGLNSHSNKIKCEKALIQASRIHCVRVKHGWASIRHPCNTTWQSCNFREMFCTTCVPRCLWWEEEQQWKESLVSSHLHKHKIFP